MRYVGTFLNAQGTEVRRTFEARNEEELRHRLKEEGLDIRELKIDGTLEVANSEATLENVSKALSITVLILAAALVFSFPFPFVRKIWFPHALGYYAITNIICFAATIWGVRRKSVIAVTSGLAILCYEQLLTWQGYLFLKLNNMVNATTWQFLGLSVTISLILFVIYLRAFYAIRSYYEVKFIFRKTPETSEQQRESYGWRLSIFCLYLMVPFLVLVLPHTLSAFNRLSTMRLLGEFTCLISALGIGYEIQKFFRNHVWNFPSLFVICFHTIALLVITYWVYHKTPIAQVYAAL